MPVLGLLLLAGVLVYLWLTRRNSTLTRACRWRQQRALGQWRCAACGAVAQGPVEPRHCLRPKD